MIKIPRGTQDILPEDSKKWRYIENQLDELMTFYNYKEIRTPIFESTDLFARGVGDSTDVVQKEMYTFKDKGDRSITLRPEGTAAVVRSYIEHKMQGNPNQPIKLYYNGPMFRYERKQKGRYRQFNQFGVEAIGAENPSVDAEVLAMVMHIYQSFGLKHLKLVINSVGDMASRKEYNEALVKHFEPVIHEFCSDCQSRLHTNPMRILDCKVDRDKEAWKQAGHDFEPRTLVTRSIQPITTDLDRRLFGQDGSPQQDAVGYLAYHRNPTIFGKTFAGEPDQLIKELAEDEAIKEADTVLVTIPNTLGVEYNMHLLETIVKDIAPELGWR